MPRAIWTGAISFGLGFNDFTHRLSEYCEERLFKIGFGPSPRDPKLFTDSFSIGGVSSNTSRITEAMKGMIMMARMTPAHRSPMPMGGPE